MPNCHCWTSQDIVATIHENEDDVIEDDEENDASDSFLVERGLGVPRFGNLTGNILEVASDDGVEIPRPVRIEDFLHRLSQEVPALPSDART